MCGCEGLGKAVKCLPGFLSVFQGKNLYVGMKVLNFIYRSYK